MDFLLAAHTLAAIGFLLSITSRFLIDDKKLLTFQLISISLFAAHYALLGATVAALGLVITCLRIALALRYRSNEIIAALCALSLTHFVIFYQHPLDLLVLFSGILGHLLFFKCKGLRLRVGMILIILCYIPIDIYHGAYVALLANTVSISTALFGLYYYQKKTYTVLEEKNAKNDRVSDISLTPSPNSK